MGMKIRKGLKWLCIGISLFSNYNALSLSWWPNWINETIYTNHLYQYGEREIVIIIPSYNNENWYERNLDSVVNQRYHNYSIIYINDCSTDDTGLLVAQYIKDKKLEHRVTLINNTERKGALANFYYAIHT